MCIPKSSPKDNCQECMEMLPWHVLKCHSNLVFDMEIISNKIHKAPVLMAVIRYQVRDKLVSRINILSL